jgi:hypothetical protein
MRVAGRFGLSASLRSPRPPLAELGRFLLRGCSARHRFVPSFVLVYRLLKLLDLVFHQMCFRFAAWSGLALGVEFPVFS